MPVSGVTVTVESGDINEIEAASSANRALRREVRGFDVTDENGRYSVEAVGRDENVLFTFNGNQVEASFALEGVAGDVGQLTINFSISEDRKSVTPTKIDVSDGGSTPPNATPTPTPEPGDDDPPVRPTPGQDDDKDDDKDDADKFVTICHKPTSGRGKPKTLTVSQGALQGHLQHGDSLGPCPAS
jgi:hypothetical protein